MVAVGGEGQAPAGVDAGVGCFRRSTVASPPGPSTVLRNSWWSYWRKTHAGSASSSSRSAPASAGAGSVRRVGEAGRSIGRLRERAVVERRVLVERRWPGCRRAPRRSSRSSTRSRPVPVTVPMTDALISHSRADGEHLVEVAGLDDGEHPLLALAGHDLEGLHALLAHVDLGRGSTSMPTPPLDAVSLVAPVMPAAPRSWMPTTRPASSISRQASMSRFSSNGSPTCTLGRFAVVASSPKPADASTLAPPMPSRPVDEPNSTVRLPTPEARASTSRSRGQQAEAEHVDERVVLVGLVEHGLAADGGHADGVAVAATRR